MSSPQTEEGYTRIANELLDAILAFDFSKRELKIVLAIVRKTYGYNKKTDDISLSQLHKITRITPSHLSPTINDLTDKKVLLKREGVHGQVIGLNKKYQNWRVLPKREYYRNSNKSVTESVNTKDNSKRQVFTYSGAIPDLVNPDAFSEFWFYRETAEFDNPLTGKKAKAPLSIPAIQKIFKKLSQFTFEQQQQMVDDAIGCGWKNLHDYKPEVKPNGANKQTGAEDNSAVARVKRAGEEWLRQQDDYEPVGENDGDLRPQVEDELRADSERILDGSFEKLEH